jgi:hypothetical protein
VRLSASEFDQSFEQLWARLDQDGGGSGEVDIKVHIGIFVPHRVDRFCAWSAV